MRWLHVDVFGFRFGIRYGDLWGHRGRTHSLMFAFCLSIVVWLVATRYVAGFAHRLLLWLYLFLASASHGVLDAFTNGGFGIAFLSPFDTTRYFFSLQPIEVSPIGVHFFSKRGLLALESEFIWVWVPSIVFAILAIVVRRLFARSTTRTTR